MVLGIDTSNYTTSVSVFDGKTVKNCRKLLPVKEGQRGLRQSEAVFRHIKQMPEVFSLAAEYAGEIDAAAVSISPRNTEGSYMPVFTVGESFAKTIAQALGVPLYRYSHQDGHIMAGLYSADACLLLKKPFISVHLSGGTTEILLSHYQGSGFNNKIIGKTLDISAGQLIDRIGVALGMKFPCGKEMDSLSLMSKKPINLPISIKDGDFNLSGAETKCKDFFDNEKPEDICMGVLLCICRTLERAIGFCIKQYNIDSVLIAGGVAANSFLRSYMDKSLPANVYFASRELSSDNAVGIAALGYFERNGLDF